MTLSPVPEALLLCSVLILLAFTPLSGSTEAVGVYAPERAIVITPITPIIAITVKALKCFLAIFFENRLLIFDPDTMMLVSYSTIKKASLFKQSSKNYHLPIL